MNSDPNKQSSSEAKIRTMKRKPTLSELHQWKNQGIRIDMPGSPLVGSFDENTAKEILVENNQQTEFHLASKNTAAVAEALERLMTRAGGANKQVEVVSAQNKPAEPAAATASLEEAVPTVEIQTWQGEADPLPQEDEPGFVFVAGKNPNETNGTTEATASEPVESSHEASSIATKTTGKMTTELDLTIPKPPTSAYRQRSLTHPKWEVDTLAWPEEIDMVLDLCGEDWQELVGNLSADIHSLAIVSLGQGCGCTTLAICLAKMLAEQNRRVLLIDEGTQPDCLTTRMGLEQALPHESTHKIETLYEVMIQSAEQPIAVLPAGYRELSDLTVNQLQQFTQDFDIVLWDGSNRPEVWQRLALVDRTLVVRDARGTHDHELGQILPKLEQRKINVIGIADNFWR